MTCMMTNKIEYYQDIIRKTYQNFVKTNDDRLRLCVLGAKFAIAKGLGPEHLDYTNPYLLDEFNGLSI